MIVLDASAVVELLLGSARGETVGNLMEGAEGALHAPALLDVEVLQGFRRLVATGILSAARGRAAVELLQELPVERHRCDPLLPRMWALRENLTAYDAAYVALAEALACPLVTFDARIAGAPGLATTVLVPGDQGAEGAGGVGGVGGAGDRGGAGDPDGPGGTGG